jgi:polysaccharide chain length determinant protein (PEP-CTERM system associated)
MKDLTHLEISDYLSIVWKRRWYCLIAFLLVISSALIYVSIVPDVYKSETRIMADAPQVSQDYVNATPGSTAEDRINSIREQLASRSFLERMIEQLQMYGYGTRSDFVMEEAVKYAQKQIGIAKTSDRTFTISYIATDPQFTQAVTKQLAQELIRISSRSKTDKVVATDQFIDEQLRQSTEALKAQEDKIKQFKLAHLGELPEQGDANMSALTGTYTQLSAAENAIQQAQERQKLLDFNYQERKRINAQAQGLATNDDAGKVAAKRTGPSPEEVELKAKKELLAQYLAKYTPIHPDVVTLNKDISRLEQQIKDAKATEEAESTAVTGSAQKGKPADQDDPLENSYKFQSDSIKAEIAKREKERQQLTLQIKQYQSRLNLAPALDQELGTLLREQEVLKTRYENLQKQKFNTQMATSVETDKKNESYRIIDEANLPVKAQYPNRLQIVLLGLVGGLALGVGAAFGRELLDNTIGGEEEAKALLNLPVLATIPTVPKENKKKKIA